jgi:Uma2 family endonuclease
MATVATAPLRPLTVEDLDEWPDSDDRYEIINGELVVTPGPVPQHQQISGRLYRSLAVVVEDGGLGLVYSSTIRVRLTPHDVVDPDLSVFLTAQRHAVTDRLVDAVPVLIVEILSPSTQRTDLISRAACG